MNDDAELLRAYTTARSEDAFTKLVKRHIGLVYSVALRRVGYDTHLAEDVAQVVFSNLARKAKSLMGRPTLSGWLYVSAHLASAEAVRKERRRRRREEASVVMQELQSSGKAEPDWEKVRPLLDSFIVKLGRVDREAVVLRFFEKRSFAEIGASLHLTEDTARKRVERALGKLRSSVVRSGFVLGATALSELLASELTPAPPAGLASKVATSALSGFATGTLGTSLVMSMLSALDSGTAVVAAIGLGLAAVVAFQHQRIEGLRSEIEIREKRGMEIRSLRAENGRMAQLWSQMRSASLSDGKAIGVPSKADRPTVSTGASERAPVPISVVWVTPEGQIRWNGMPVTLAEFLQHLTSYRASDPDPDGKILISGMVQGAPPFSAFAYAVEQASKAGIKNITFSMPPSPTPSDINWLSAKAPVVGEIDPPTLPEQPPPRK